MTTETFSSQLVQLGAKLARVFPSRRKSASLLLRTVSDLRSEIETASSVCHGTADQFLVWGQNLHHLQDLSTKLVGSSETLLSLALGNDAARQMLRDTGHLVSQPLELDGVKQRELGALLDQLNRCADQMKGIRSVEKRMTESLSQLRVIQILFRVEAARLPPESELKFRTLTDEILRLESTVAESSAWRFQELAETRNSILRVTAQIRAGARQRAERTNKLAERLQQSLDNLTRQITDNSMRDVGLNRVSQELAAHVDKLVVGLQIQDIVSQKLGHLHEAIVDLEAECRDAVATGSDLTPHWNRLLFLAQVHHRQLETIASQLETTEQTVRDEMALIHERASLVDHECILVDGFRDTTEGAIDIVQALLNTMSDCRTLCDEAARDSANCLEFVTPLKAAASDLNQTMLEVAQRIRRVALNAQIESEHLGQETGLSVLAANTAAVSRSTEDMSGEIAAISKELHDNIGHIESQFAQATHEWQALQEQLNIAGGEQESRLHSLRDEMLAELRRLGDAVDQIRTSTEDVAKGIVCLSDGREQISRASHFLDTAIHATRATGFIDHTAATDDSRMTDQYTRSTRGTSTNT